jgi:hypothetical protein
MRSTIVTLFAASLVQLASTSPAQAGSRQGIDKHSGRYELPLSDLRKAAARADRAELSRVASRLGPGRLEEALVNSDRQVVLAALEALPLVDAGILLLANCVPLLAGPDAGVRAQATRTIADLLAATDARQLGAWEIAEETKLAACRALARVARDEAEEPATRIVALQGLSDAGRMCTGTSIPQALLASANPEIRRAAVLSLPMDSANGAANALGATASVVTSLLKAAKDPDGRVAAAAGAQWCKLHAKEGKSQSPSVTPPIAPPLRALARADRALPEDVIDMLPCLSSSSDPDDKRALDELRTKGSAAVREAIRATAASDKVQTP